MQESGHQLREGCSLVPQRQAPLSQLMENGTLGSAEALGNAAGTGQETRDCAREISEEAVLKVTSKERESSLRPSSVSRHFNRKMLGNVYLAVEAMGILIPGILLAHVYVGQKLQVPDYHIVYIYPIAVYLVAVITIFHNKGLYRFAALRNFASSVGNVLSGLLLSLACLVMTGFVLNVANDYSRIWVVGLFVTSAIVILFSRAVASRLFSNLIANNHILQATAIYGPRDHALAIAARLNRSGTGVGVTGLFGPSVSDKPAEAQEPAGMQDLLAHARSRRVDSILVVADPRSADQAEKVIAALSALPLEVRLIFVSAEDSAPVLGTSYGDGLRYFEVQAPPISSWGYFVKSVFDRVAAALLLLILLPWMVLIAIAIRLDSPGPVFFFQQRHGFNQNVFRIIKFRTMHVLEDGENVVQATRGDARLTRIGALLRKTSFDELPQLLNVLRGEMSLVGPRPHPLGLNFEYEGLLERYANRHKVKPGITGLAQVHGLRGAADPHMMRARLEDDLRYIETWSLWLDVKILAATPFLGIVNRNAF